ncbi:MAG: chorismate mutase [Chloroflexota bacterium]
MTMFCRGVRGATTIENDTAEEIIIATGELLQLIVHVNDIDMDDVASAIFTTTIDVNAAFPALAARKMGWGNVPLICAHEMTVPNSLQKCIRILLHWNTTKLAKDIQHIYIKGAKNLRPDLAELQQLPDLPLPTSLLDEFQPDKK